ncbi:MAG: hypothetical protein HY033_13370 [Ignavibacteriae bacterium]|nr:hypothetical protein [Ignavibacteria bacterium]MBI3365883.1 hypothetical protein [Ignavibacteriota bacterium]
MSDTQQHSSAASTAEIRIVGLNTDKTRKTEKSDTLYQVYFELSGTPSQTWRNSFEREWKALNPAFRQQAGWQEASIDREFLVIHCTLQEVATQLQVLKKAIAATNKTYEHDVQEQAAEQERRDDVWKLERKAVDDMAKSLRFD